MAAGAATLAAAEHAAPQANSPADSGRRSLRTAPGSTGRRPRPLDSVLTPGAAAEVEKPPDLGREWLHALGAMRAVAFGICLLAGGSPLLAALEWPTTEVHLQAALGQEQAVAIFPYRNAGRTPVRILLVTGNCRCIAADPVKDVCAPGDSGEIRARFTFAGSVGRQVKSIAVTTDEAAGQPTVLTLVVDIPQLIEVIPRFLFWEQGSQPEEKSADVVVAGPERATIDGVRCENPVFVARLQRAGAGRYRLRVRPTDTHVPSSGTVALKVTIGDESRDYQVYVAVK